MLGWLSPTRHHEPVDRAIWDGSQADVAPRSLGHAIVGAE